MLFRGWFRLLTLSLILVFGHFLLADTMASVSAQANYTSDSKSYQLCTQGSTCVVVAPGPSTPGAGTLQSQANDGDASAEAHVDLQTGSMGVQASGYSRADAEFSNAFYCTSSSPCEVVPTGGIQALMHFSLDGTILPPSVAGNGSYGGYLEAGFDFTENDIGGGSLSFRFETDYDDTLDQPPTFQVTFNGQQYTPTYKYETQPDGSVKVSMSWDQPFTLCTYGCNGSSASSYAISGGGSEGSLFGTTEKAYITSDGVGAADFSHTFTTSITSLDPRYTFFSDSGLLAPTTTRTPEPGSMVLLISGLFGVPWLSRRKKRS